MLPMKTPGGLVFRRLDLHVHTPASKCFRGTCSPKDIVDASIAQGLAGIAITDHNSAEWVDQVMDAAKGTQLVVFPGVEVTCTGGTKGIHILALFDVDKGAAKVRSLLTLLGIEGGFGEEGTITVKAPLDVIRCISDEGGLAVLAHSNSTCGVLADMQGAQRTRIIRSGKLAAVEATDFRSASKAGRRSRVVDLLDGNDPTYRRKLAVYQASDNPCPDNSGRHSLEGIGTRTTYFKLESVNLAGLRQCFIDPDVRMRLEHDYAPSSYPYISSVHVTSGFLDGQSFHFHPGLTSVLGAKGAGKSLLIEFMRFALNQEPRHTSVASDHYGKLEERLGGYGSIELRFVDQAGEEYVIKRVYRGVGNSPYDDSIPYDPAQVFPVLFLSQNEIIKVAEDEHSQLEFIDQFFDFRTRRQNIESHERDLEQLDKQMAEGLRANAEYSRLGGKLASLEIELGRIERALKNPIFEEYRHLQLKDDTLRRQLAYLDAIAKPVQEAQLHLRGQAIPDLPEPLASDPVILRTRDAITAARELLEERFSSLVNELGAQSGRAKAEYVTWQHALAVGKKKYEDSIQQMGSDYRGLALSRERLMRQIADLRTQMNSAKRKKDQLSDVNRRREELLNALQSEYDLYTQERQEKCSRFQEDSSGRLRLHILGSSNVDEFRSRLLELKRGSYLREEEIDAICSSTRPRDFVLSLLRYHATDKASYLVDLARDAGIDERRMKTLADFLLNAIPYEDLLAMQYKAQPTDRPEILYNIGDGDYQPLAKVSVGQKCTAMLIIALSDGNMPIVIDQPEDSLDIRSIWDDMCTRLRNGKDRRQFIFTTHNSSLAVASDTDRYLVLQGCALTGQVAYAGSMDHQPVAGEVLRYLEGGPVTYDLKYAKYGRTDGTEEEA